MKTLALLALIFGWTISAYSQMNTNRKAGSPIQVPPFDPDKKNYDLGNYNFADKFTGFNERVWDSRGISAMGPVRGKLKEPYAWDNMPCYKPEGLFSMRTYKPDSTVTYNILLKKY